MRVVSEGHVFFFLADTGSFAAKNLILAGVRSLTIHDEGLVELADLSAQVHPPPTKIIATGER